MRPCAEILLNFSSHVSAVQNPFLMSSCNICHRRVLKHSYQLKCCICSSLVHLKCLPQINKTDSVYTERESNNWSCTKCNQSLFPFNHYYDDTDYFSAIDEQFIAQSSVPFDMLVKSDLLFSPFDTNDSDFNCMNDIDPDVHFYNSHLNSDSLSCEYYLEDMFNSKISNMNILANNLSMLNTNIRSMPKNLSKLKCYLENLNHKFTIHSFTESWI